MLFVFMKMYEMISPDEVGPGQSSLRLIVAVAPVAVRRKPSPLIWRPKR